MSMAEGQGCAPKFRTSIGGQALIEGILMRGPGKQAIVVRSTEGLVVKEEAITLTRDKYPILGLPVLRGAVTFVDSMVRGVKALLFSADYFPDDETVQPSKFDRWIERHFSGETAQKLVAGLAVALSLGLTVALFFLLPTFLAGFVDPYIRSAAAHNLVESVLKLAIFFAYLLLVSKQKDIQRVFQYHGAEHKTIFCYEAGLPLTVENCRAQSRFHPRCGTSFLFVVIVISVDVFVTVTLTVCTRVRTEISVSAKLMPEEAFCAFDDSVGISVFITFRPWTALDIFVLFIIIMLLFRGVRACFFRPNGR